ncbi:hypothetical protein GM661_13390 [Iocasia frigidifontis]|uniref:Uncharacterized protein n=1 Tax=Iocasia fonsfrigidae TaxID=2682810 RepID=A0A8A7KLB8_9FIRM|nr:hypothetical protein [Iocasia fonsfrigidae]QTL98884.1 hypothetical protein GM661_13390 [Iocasia fonsfrigidae]
MYKKENLNYNLRTCFTKEDLDLISCMHDDSYFSEYGFDKTFGKKVKNSLYQFDKKFTQGKDNLFIAEF